LVPSVRVGDIVDQVRAAFVWVIDRIAPERIVVAGHSAGGQLAAMLALDQAERGLGPIVGLAGISGAFDLRPLLRTSINVDLNLSAEEAEAASPLLRLRALPPMAPLMPLLAVVGGDETDGFKQWTADMVHQPRSWNSLAKATSPSLMLWRRTKGKFPVPSGASSGDDRNGSRGVKS
jgi:arylformamidase